MSGHTNNLSKNPFATQHRKVIKIGSRKAISLLELLVSITIIAISATILMPTLITARQKAFAVKCMDNQRQIAISVNAFAEDHNGEYPESVATIGLLQENWNWQEPTMLTACRPLSANLHRSLSAYLYSYIRDVRIISCPAAPSKNMYLQQAWDAGDDWDNPETNSPQDPVMGTYCFYWKYTGFLKEGGEPFKGPRSISSEPGRSKLLVSDYFGFGHWRNKSIYGDYRAYGSCERLKTASITPGTAVSSSFWSRLANDPNITTRSFNTELHAAYTDGHVERYSPSQTIIMKVSQTPDGSVPYPDELGPGDFYLPEKALY